MSQDLISVIIPVYNAAPYLERCISSVMENTYKNVEIICINDGSTDDSLKILNRLAAQDARIRVIDQPNSGVAAARNHGLDVANGEYVAFVDSDDWIHREHLFLLHTIASNNQADLVVGGYVQVREFDDSQRVQAFSHQADIKTRREELHISGNLTNSPWCKLFKRSAVGELRFPVDICFGEDQVFNVQFFSSRDELHIRWLDLPIYFYFDRPGSLVHNPDVNRFWQIANHYLDHMQNYKCKDIPLSHTYRMLYSYRYEGSINGDQKAVSRNARAAFRRARYWLLREKRFSAKQKLKYLVAAASPSLYRAQLLAKDPTMRTHERILQERTRTNLEKQKR